MQSSETIVLQNGGVLQMMQFLFGYVQAYFQVSTKQAFYVVLCTFKLRLPKYMRTYMIQLTEMSRLRLDLRFYNDTQELLVVSGIVNININYIYIHRDQCMCMFK